MFRGKMSCLTYVLSGGASVVYTHRPKRAGRIAWPPLTCVSSFFYIITQKKSELCVPSEKLPLLGNIHMISSSSAAFDPDQISAIM